MQRRGTAQAVSQRVQELADIGVIWFARSQAEYEQAIALGMVAGWPSFEQYEAYHLDVIESGNWFVIVRSVVDIVGELSKRHIENTPDGRAHLFGLLFIEIMEERKQ